MTENEVLKKIKSRFAKELKDFIGEGNLLDLLSAFLGNFQNAVSNNKEINIIDARNHLGLLEPVQGNEVKLKSHFNKKLSLQGLFLIYEKAYQLLKKDSKKGTQEVVSGIYGIVKKSKLGEQLNEIMDDNNKLSLLNVLANPEGTPAFATEEDFENQVLANIRNLLNRDAPLNDSDKELALTQLVVSFYSSIHEDIKIKNENLVSLMIAPLTQHIKSYILDLSTILHKFPFPATEENISTEIQEFYPEYILQHDYLAMPQEHKLDEAFKCLLMHDDTDSFEKILTNPENMFCNLVDDTTLHLAAGLGYTDIVNDLIRDGKDINLQGRYGYTPLHYAAQNGYKDVVALLLEEEADPLLKNKCGRTAKDLCEDDGIKKLLEKAEKSQALTRSFSDGCSIAALGAAIVVTLLAIGIVAVELVSVIVAVAIVTAVAFAAGYTTYKTLKPSTEVNIVKEEKTARNEKEEVHPIA